MLTRGKIETLIWWLSPPEVLPGIGEDARQGGHARHRWRSPQDPYAALGPEKRYGWWL